jgi:hypothetical protein
MVRGSGAECCAETAVLVTACKSGVRGRAQTLPPRPLPRTVTPVLGQYYLDYISRLADANHLELLELTGALDDPAAVILDLGRRHQHQQGRLAAAAAQPLPRIARLYWDDADVYLRGPGRFRRMLRPA